MDGDLAGKTVLVTGAARGIGRAIAIKMAECGSNVIVNYRINDQAAAEVIQIIAARGGQALAIQADVRDSEAVKYMFRQIIDRWEKIDILVNNAGITRDVLLPRMSEEAWDEVIDINLKGAYLCTRFALRSMLNQPWGRIINIASVAGLVGNAGQTNYSASKGGLIAFTRAVAREVGARNITANVIAPGFFVTEMTNQLPPATRDAILNQIPLRRYGQPEEIAELVAFLASERAGYITAQVIAIDGGVV